MTTEATEDAIQVFRLRRSIQLWAIAGTRLFATAAVACVSVAFLDDPKKHGFQGEHAVAFSLVIGVFFWGGWTLLSVYTLVAYFVQRVTVVGSLVAVKSAFQHRQFDASEVTELRWKVLP